MENPNWFIIALIGAFLGYILPYLFLSVKYLLRSFKKHYLEGTWFGYYFIWVGNVTELRKEVWKIKKGFKNNLRVKISNLPERNLSYNGYLEIERDQLIVKLNALEIEEEVICRLKIPIPTNDKILQGLWIGLDFNGHASVGPHIVTREELDLETAKEKLIEFIELDKKHMTMRIIN